MAQLITGTIPERVAADTAYNSARRNSDAENARIKHDKALLRVMTSMMKDYDQLFKSSWTMTAEQVTAAQPNLDGAA